MQLNFNRFSAFKCIAGVIGSVLSLCKPIVHKVFELEWKGSKRFSPRPGTASSIDIKLIHLFSIFLSIQSNISFSQESRPSIFRTFSKSYLYCKLQFQKFVRFPSILFLKVSLSINVDLIHGQTEEIFNVTIVLWWCINRD